MNSPFISFIVPVYKVEEYLHECVDSIIGQTCDDWELILIDDGSPDGCPQICDEYAASDRRIKVIHQQNKGVAAARNAGLDIATGEWIWFVDSDDWIASESVQRLKDKLGGVKCDFVMFSYTVWKTGGKRKVPISLCHDCDKKEFLKENICFHNQRILFKRELIENMDTVVIDQIMFGHIRHEGDNKNIQNGINDISGNKGELLNRHHSFFNPCMLFRNDKIQEHKLRFTEGIRLAEDLEFQYKYEMLCQHPVAIDDALYQYRIREGSVTHTGSYRTHAVEDISKVLRNLLDFICVHNIKQEDWLDKRLEMLMKNMLYSASQVTELNIAAFQEDVRSIIDGYRKIGFKCFEGKKIRLAYHSVKWYFITNKIYLKLKGIS